MKEPHEILGVSRTASQQEIKAAYKKKSLTAHPDKGGTDEKFNELSTAYRVLSNIEADESETSGLWWNPYPTKFNHRKVQFTLLENPFSYNNYEYLEKAFDREEFLDYDLNYFDKPIQQRMVSIYFMRDKICHIDARLTGEHRTFDADNRLSTRWYIEPEIIAKDTLFKDNLEKIRCSLRVLQKPPSAKRALYDYSLGLTELEDNSLIELVKNMGGRDSLKKMIGFKPDMEFIPYLQALDKSNLLTPENIEQTISCINLSTTPWFSSFYEQKWGFKCSESDRDSFFRNLNSVTEKMSKASLLSQNNFNLLIENILTIDHIENAVTSLIIGGRNLDFQQHFLKCIKLGSDAADYMYSKTGLLSSRFYNDDILETLGTQGLIKCSIYPLRSIKDNYDESYKTAFQYQGSEAEKPLVHAINQLFIHGLLIDCCQSWPSEMIEQAQKKAELCISLAIELKKEFYDFCQLSEAERKETFDEFQERFIKKLHNQDEKLSKHRYQLSRLIDNILMALWDIGKLLCQENQVQAAHSNIIKPKSRYFTGQIEMTFFKSTAEHPTNPPPQKPFYSSFLYKT